MKKNNGMLYYASSPSFFSPRCVSCLLEVIFARARILSHSTIPEKNEGLSTYLGINSPDQKQDTVESRYNEFIYNEVDPRYNELYNILNVSPDSYNTSMTSAFFREHW